MNKLLKPLLIGLCAGVAVAVIQQAFHLKAAAVIGIFCVGCVALVLAVYGYHLFWAKRVQRTLALLEEERMEEFIAESLRLREKTKNKSIRNTLEINLSAAYFRRGQYDKAIILLQNLSHSQLQPRQELVRRLNLCMSYFYAGQEEQAMELYRDSQPLFRAEPSEALAGNLAALDVLAAMRTGELDRAGQLLRNAQEKWKNPRLQKTFSELEARLAKKRL